MRVTERQLRKIVRNVLSESKKSLSGKIKKSTSQETYVIQTQWLGNKTSDIVLDFESTLQGTAEEFKRRAREGLYVVLKVEKSSGKGDWSLRSINAIEDNPEVVPMAEHFRHSETPHKHTPTSKRVMKSFQRNSSLQKSFDSIQRPHDLAAIIEEIIDASGLSRQDVQQALNMILRHERPR